MILRRTQVAILRAAVIENLDLNSKVCGITLQRRADTDPVVGVLGQLEFEAEDKVRVFLRGEEVSAVLFSGEEDPALDLVTLARSVLGTVGALAVHPPGQVLAVEERRESFLRV